MFYDFSDAKKVDPLFSALEACRDIAQNGEYHPEGDVLNHSLQVLRWAFRESTDVDLIVAAMLHDVGKRIETHGHERHGVDLVEGYISEKTKWLILNHRRIWGFVLGEMKKRSKVVSLSVHPWLPELVLLARWDKLGRDPNRHVKYDRNEIRYRLQTISCRGESPG